MGKLLQFQQAVDDAQLRIVTQLDLDHLRGEVLADLLDFLDAELQLSPGSLRPHGMDLNFRIGDGDVG